MVMETSWNMNWPKVTELCDPSWNFTNFAPELYQICIFFGTTRKLSNYPESPFFPTFSAKRRKCKTGKRNGHGKSRKSHGKIFCRVCGNPGSKRLSKMTSCYFLAPPPPPSPPTICHIGNPSFVMPEHGNYSTTFRYSKSVLSLLPNCCGTIQVGPGVPVLVF